MYQEGKKLNPHANTPTAVKMNELNPKYENTQVIKQSKSRILTIHTIQNYGNILRLHVVCHINMF
jgi:hypothetical protein